LVVRTARPEDADAIARVHIRSWQRAYSHAFSAEALESLGETHERRAERWRSTTKDPAPRSHTLVAEADDEVVGFAFVAPARDEHEQCGELYMIYVAPEAWGRGAGRALMAELLSRLRGEGFSEAILWVLEDNPRTRRFYELAGWRLDGGARDDTYLDRPVRVIRYRIALDASE
jgi:GNAT superfamily N-acetyltransferase